METLPLLCYIIADIRIIDIISELILLTTLKLGGSISDATANPSSPTVINPDFIYLQSSYYNGWSEHLSKLNYPFHLVIISDKIEDAYDAFEHRAFDFLLEPLNLTRFTNVLHKYEESLALKAMKRLKSEGLDEMFFLKIGHVNVMFSYSEIIYIEAMQNYVKIKLENGKNYLSYNTMKKMEEQLPNHSFSRVHKSFIVNKKKIKSIERNFLLLSNIEETKIVIGKFYRKKFSTFI